MIRKRGKRYQVRVSHGYDPVTGRRAEEYVGTFATKRAAEEAQADALHRRSHGLSVAPERITVNDLLDRWLEAARPNLAPLTYRRYQSLTSRWKQLLGTLRLRDLRVGHVQAAVAAMQEQLSARTIEHHLRLFKQAMRQAIAWQFIGMNPADGVKAPRRKELLKVQTVPAERLAELLGLFDGQERRLVHVTVSTGMRRGEVLALSWASVNLAEGWAEVRRTIQYSTQEGLYFRDQPKTSHSLRRINLGPETIAVLRAQRAYQLEQRLQNGEGFNPRGLVFTDQLGGPLHPDIVSRHFIRTARKAGFTELRFHDLRHTMATVMLARGTPLKVVSERLGHASAGFTLTVYGHVVPGMDARAAADFDSVISGSKGR